MPHAAFTLSSTLQLVAPGDLQTIYNFNRLYSAGISGSGQQIAVIEDSDLYSAGNWDAFRKTLGLALRYGAGRLVVEHPQGSGGGCADPGINADDAEATIDAEWASAAAPDATIVLASCASTEATPGIFIALQNLLTSATPPKIISLSYGEFETELGAAGNAYVNALSRSLQHRLLHLCWASYICYCEGAISKPRALPATGSRGSSGFAA